MPELIDICSEADPGAALEMLGVTFEQIRAELEYRQRKKLARAMKEIAVAAKQGGERRLIRGKDGGGEQEMMIHPVSYHYWGQRLGYECWDDPQFRREYRRDNEASRVKTINDRLTITKTVEFKPAQRRGVTGKRGRWAA